jgi:hypothetical protein
MNPPPAPFTRPDMNLSVTGGPQAWFRGSCPSGAAEADSISRGGQTDEQTGKYGEVVPSTMRLLLGKIRCRPMPRRELPQYQVPPHGAAAMMRPHAGSRREDDGGHRRGNRHLDCQVCCAAVDSMAVMNGTHHHSSTDSSQQARKKPGYVT